VGLIFCIGEYKHPAVAATSSGTKASVSSFFHSPGSFLILDHSTDDLLLEGDDNDDDDDFFASSPLSNVPSIDNWREISESIVDSEYEAISVSDLTSNSNSKSSDSDQADSVSESIDDGDVSGRISLDEESDVGSNAL
jgi:hypothetical protein